MTSCPSAATLRAFASGELPEESVVAVSDHLDRCDGCRSALSATPTAHDTLLASLRLVTETDDYTDEHAFQKLMSAMSGPSYLPLIDGSATALVHRRIRDYEILDKLGEGSMGTVYRARHTRLDKLVAIKVLHPGWSSVPEAVARFEQEIRAVAALGHGHIVRATDAGEDNGLLFLVMELLHGIDCDSMVRRIGALQCAEACEIVRQAALGLQYASQKGVVHRDVKPSNLMITNDGIVKVLDLGLARLLENTSPTTRLTQEGQVLGTLDFMAPEQVRGDVDEIGTRTDVYGLGCTLLFLLTGKAPAVEGPESTELSRWKVARGGVPRLSVSRDDLPQKLRTVLQRLIAYEPSLRYSEPGAVAAALDEFAIGCDLARTVRLAQEPDTPCAQLTPSTKGDYSLRRRKQRSTVVELLKVALGGLIGITLANVLCLGFGIDVLGVFSPDRPGVMTVAPVVVTEQISAGSAFQGKIADENSVESTETEKPQSQDPASAPAHLLSNSDSPLELEEDSMTHKTMTSLTSLLLTLSLSDEGISQLEAASTKDATQKYVAAVKELDKRYTEQIAALRKTYIGDLDAAATVALAEKKRQEATRILAMIENLKQEVPPTATRIAELEVELQRLRRVKTSGRRSTNRIRIPDSAIEWNGHHYLRFDESETWSVAKQRAEELGGHLVRIDTQAEDAFVFELIRNGTSPWYRTDGSDELEEGYFRFSDGAPVTYFNWSENEPDDNKTSVHQHDLIISPRSGKLFDGHCGERSGWVVEWDR